MSKRLNPIKPGTFWGQICPQAFSLTPGGSDLLKKEPKIKFSHPPGEKGVILISSKVINGFWRNAEILLHTKSHFVFSTHAISRSELVQCHTEVSSVLMRSTSKKATQYFGEFTAFRISITLSMTARTNTIWSWDNVDANALNTYWDTITIN